MSTVSVISRMAQEVLDVNQIWQLIQELVSFVASREKPVSVGTSRQSSQQLALAGECTCPCFFSRVNPALWSTLPDELVKRVFARLPLPKINELRILSKQWNLRFMTPEYTDFMWVCSEAHPKIFGMITQGPLFGELTVRLYDTEANRWYLYVKSMAEKSAVTMSAGDGGLVCIVSASVITKENPLLIIVFNPLTRQGRPLSPPTRLRTVQPCMVQLVMDDSRKCYKVIVAIEQVEYSGERGTQTIADVYCSATGVWRSVKAKDFPNLVFGYRYHWNWLGGFLYPSVGLEETLLGPCAYDSAGREIVNFVVQNIPAFEGILCESCALVKDRLFLLHLEELEGTDSDGFVTWHRGYVVSEYQLQDFNSEPNWVKVKVHRCAEFEYPSNRGDYQMTLYACRGFLLVKAAKQDSIACERELTWLNDLSTRKWQKLPAIPCPSDLSQDAMFELRWDAAP